jgi:peptidoglycan-N-acetylglucosamine deacetylase
MPFRVALTFDTEHPDRPHHEPGGVRAILESLAAHDTRATFFLQGRWVESAPLVAGAIARAGHLIGSHSHYHVHMDLLSDAGFRIDVERAERAIRQHAMTDPRPWMRFPFGSAADDPNRVDLLMKLLPSLGYRHVGWHVEANDWLSSATADRVAALIASGAKAHGDGAIVLLHSWPGPVAGALAIALPALMAAGARFVRVDELDLPPGLGSVADRRPVASSTAQAAISRGG